MAEEVATLAPSAGAELQTAAPPTATETDEPIAQPGEVQPETEALSATETEPEETEVDLEAAPESSGDFDKYKPLYKENPDLRQIVGRERAFSEIAPNGSFQELKQIVERVPTLEDADSLATAAENHRILGETYRNDPAGFVETLKDNDPLAFQQLAKQLPNILAQSDPASYREQASYYVERTIDNLFAIAQRQNNTEALSSIQNVAQMLGVQLGMPRTAAQPGNSEVERLRQQLQEREQADVDARAASFWDSANNIYISNTQSEIEAVIQKSIPDVNEAQLKRMAGEVWEGVNSRLGAQPQTMSQIENFKKNVLRGRMGPADQRAIVDFSTKRAKLLIPQVWKEVSAEWSKQIVSFNQKQIEKKRGAAAASGQAGPTGAPTTSATPRTNPIAQQAGARRSFKSVFESLSRGTYQKPA